MRYFPVLTLLFAASLWLNAVIEVTAQVPTFGILYDGHLRAQINNDGSLFYNRSLQQGEFEVPAGSYRRMAYNAAFCISGSRQNTGLLHGSTYELFGDHFKHGPYAPDLTAAQRLVYNTVWYLSKSEVEAHQANWDQPGYEVPFAIKHWPANGDTQLGEMQRMAPYEDVNNNGIYDPENGDYPCILGDQNVFTMFNDYPGKPDPASKRLGVEVHLTAYTHLPKTTDHQVMFVNYKVFNRSGFDYSDIYLGFMADLDIGDPANDYFGSDSALNAFFVYNSTNLDTGNFAVLGYDNSPPAMGVVFLDHALHASMEIGAHPIDRRMGSLTGMNHLLQGRWPDGSPVYEDKDGHEVSGKVTRFMFSGDPNDPRAWSQPGEGIRPSDHAGLGSIGPFEMADGSRLEFTVAFVYGRGPSTNSSIDNMGVMKQAIRDTKAFFEANQKICGRPVGVAEHNMVEPINIYPNPSKGIIQLGGDLSKLSAVSVHDLLGHEVRRYESVPSLIDLSESPNGIYFVRLQLGGQTQTHKVVLSR